MIKQNSKYKWLVSHDFAVRQIEETENGGWEVWDTIGGEDSYRIVMPTRRQAINEAFEFLSEGNTIDPIKVEK
jgi:hypothetical protein